MTYFLFFMAGLALGFTRGEQRRRAALYILYAVMMFLAVASAAYNAPVVALPEGWQA